MRRWLFLILGGIVAAAALFYVNREPIVLDLMAMRVPKAPLAEREALLAPAMQFHPPAEGSPPYPAVIQFHGCSSMRQNFMDQWATVANDAGFMAVIVDSHSPRGIDRARGSSSVCEGKELIGQERAGDVLAAYHAVARRSDVDASKIVLAGWSHGAWSIMDFLALDPPRKLPAGITRGGVGEADIAGLSLSIPIAAKAPGRASEAGGATPALSRSSRAPTPSSIRKLARP